MGLLDRLRKFKDYVSEVSIIFFTVAIVIIWWWLFFPKIGFDSSQWVLSALIQSLSAILGLLIVLYIFIYSKKSELMEKLSKFEFKYHDMLISPTEDGTPFIIKLREKFFGEIKSNSLKYQETEYLEQLYSISALAEYMILTHQLKFSSNKIRDDLKSTGYYEKISGRPFGCYPIGGSLMAPEDFFNHILNLPFIADGELNPKQREINRGLLLKDNIPRIKFLLENIGKLISNRFTGLNFFIFTNIVGDIMMLSITTKDSFDYMTKILIGIFISSGLVAFFVLLNYILYIIKIPEHQH